MIEALQSQVVLCGVAFYWLDIIGTALGLLYLLLEYRASVWLWPVSIVMPLVHGYLYFMRGLYADSALDIYFVLAAIYGWVVWLAGKRGNGGVAMPIIHAARSSLMRAAGVTALLWGGIYALLVTWTDSTVPALDAFTTALSITGMWALSRKWVEQWLMWFVVDAVSAALYVYKGIPFTAALYVIYTVMAIAGYYKWRGMARASV